MSRVAVLVSGGVDSAVALQRLVDAGEHEVRACYLKIWLEDDLAHLGECPWEEDLDLVRRLCAGLGVPLEVIPLQREYHQRVVDHTLAELARGRTPSPDVLCNRRIKFGAFIERLGSGVELVASGHHARIAWRGSDAHLLKGVDPVKDQTYFLCQLSQEQLRRCLFPIGDLTKAEIRALARRWDLPSADRPDSQGICFLGRIPYREFVRYHLGERPGEIVDSATGRVLGEHRGAWFHTIGQRRGLGLAGGPWYVVAKDLGANRIVVAHGERLEEERRDRFTVSAPSWIVVPPTRSDLDLRLRHGERVIPARVELAAGAVEVTLSEPDPGVAPGQYAVFYDGDECLGGGAID